MFLNLEFLVCLPRFQGNGYCDDYNNREECAFDGGDVRMGPHGQDAYRRVAPVT